MNFMKNKEVRNAIMIGGLCSVSYLAVYFARNILGAVTPRMIEGGFTTEYIGSVSSLYFIFYAIGQLINGAVGDKIKARYMISLGLIFAGASTVVFRSFSHLPQISRIAYAMTGFFLSMIYGPMTKVVAENTAPIYATRCSLGYEFASLIGSPVAGLAASFMAWQSVFTLSSGVLFVMGGLCFVVFMTLEKKGIVQYNRYDRPKSGQTGGISVLINHRIVKFTLISVITGIIRTTVVFWLPTYISDYLGFSFEKSALIFTVSTLVISLTTFIAIFIYERLGYNMDKTILLMFSVSALCFMGVYTAKHPWVNIVFMVMAIMASGGAATMLWSRYCPSLRDTGMVSGATGFLDFVSYMAAAASSTIFANAVSVIGWGRLILVWFAIMVTGVIVALPWKIHKPKTAQ